MLQIERRLEEWEVVGYEHAIIKRRFKGKTIMIRKLWIMKDDATRHESGFSTTKQKKSKVMENQRVAIVGYNQSLIDQGPQRKTCKTPLSLKKSSL